jgi:hypothetical protein
VDKFIARVEAEKLAEKTDKPLKKIDMAKLNVGDIIEVHGFTMLRGMKGKLRVAYADVMGEKHAYWFTRPKALSLLWTPCIRC